MQKNSDLYFITKYGPDKGSVYYHPEKDELGIYEGISFWELKGPGFATPCSIHAHGWIYVGEL